MKPVIFDKPEVVIAAANVIFLARRVVDVWRPTVPEISAIADLARALEDYDEVASDRARNL